MEVMCLVVSENKIVYVCSVVSLFELMIPGVEPFLPQRPDSQDLCKALHNNAAYQI